MHDQTLLSPIQIDPIVKLTIPTLATEPYFCPPAIPARTSAFRQNRSTQTPHSRTESSMFYPKLMTAGLYAISSGLRGGEGVRMLLQSDGMPATGGTEGPIEAAGRGGRMLLQSVGSLSQAQFIVVIIGSIVGFLVIVALILMVVMIAR